MRRVVVALLVAAVSVASAAPPWPENPDGGPSVTDPSIPLSYVGNDASVSLGVNESGHTEGQILAVFARSNAHAAVGQLWWDRSGAGGVQADFNWLWGITPAEARLHPDESTVARLSFAVDQNGDHDRKATVGFGIERREFSIEGYLSGGITGARRSDVATATDLSTISGIDDIGSYTQTETTTTQTIFDRRPYGTEVGVQLSHVFEGTALRLHGGASAQDGNGGARANTFSLGIDTPLGTRGWGLSALAEHVSKRGSEDDDSDDRIAVYLRYEFGSHGSFVPTSQLEDPAWISRSLARPSSAHPRVVESYRTQKNTTVNVTRSPKQYTDHFPIARDDSALATNGLPATIAVLANDTDPDGDALIVSAVTQPSHGSAAIAGTMVIYTPAAGFSGVDTFRYTVSDGHGGSAGATVTVTTSPRPDRPPQAVRDAATTSYGRPVTIDVLANDSDPDNDTLAIDSVTQPEHGSVRINGGRVIYTPDPGFSGTDRFTYTVVDGHGGTSSATVTVTVGQQPNRPPRATDDAATTAFGVPATIDVLANDTDPDGDALTITAVTPPASGTATTNGTAITYTPAAGFAGVDRFTYTISDGRGGTSSATVTVTVTPQPNRPPVAVDDTATTIAPQPVTIAVLANDSDPDGDPLTIIGVTAPASGTVAATGNAIVYTPAAGFVGTDRFTYTIDDGHGGSATANVSVTVNPPLNLPPIAANDAATTVSGTAVAINVLANDSDPDGDPLTIQSVTTPQLGAAQISGRQIVYTPAAGLLGTDTFNYTINDGRGGTATATVTVTITPPPNAPPIAADDAATTAFATPVMINVIANDSDPDGDALTVVAVTQPTGGLAEIVNNQVTYSPSRAFSGLDTFTYTINDGHGHTATANVSVNVLPIPRPN